jgi:glycerol kinase
MGRKKAHTPEEIVAKLRQVEVLAAQGKAVAEAVRAIGVTEQTYATSCWIARCSTRSGRPRC